MGKSKDSKTGQRYGTIATLSRLLGIGVQAIRSRVHKSGSAPILGKGKSGQFCDFYSEIEVRKACADLLASGLPEADGYGSLSINGVLYGTVASLSLRMGFSVLAVHSRVRGSKISSIRGKDKSGHVFEFYPEPEVRKACADLLASLPSPPKVDKDGFIYKNTETGKWVRKPKGARGRHRTNNQVQVRSRRPLKSNKGGRRRFG